MIIFVFEQVAAVEGDRLSPAGRQNDVNGSQELTIGSMTTGFPNSIPNYELS